jgi:hypothetical protein
MAIGRVQTERSMTAFKLIALCVVQPGDETQLTRERGRLSALIGSTWMSVTNETLSGPIQRLAAFRGAFHPKIYHVSPPS